MRSILIPLFILFSQLCSAQIPIWSVCVEENHYQYCTWATEFKTIHKYIRFCYNDHYFGFVTEKDGYIQVFPLEQWNEVRDSKTGYIKEEFINGKCDNKSRGDIVVTITHGKPNSILIQNTREGSSYAYYIETNSLTTMKVAEPVFKEKRAIIQTDIRFPNDSVYPSFDIDSFFSHFTKWGNSKLAKSEFKTMIAAHINISISNTGVVKFESVSGYESNTDLLNPNFRSQLNVEKELKIIVAKMPKWVNKTPNKNLRGKFSVMIK